MIRRMKIKAHERGLLVLLSRIVHGWRNALLLVKPETVLRWHREGYRLLGRRSLEWGMDTKVPPALEWLPIYVQTSPAGVIR